MPCRDDRDDNSTSRTSYTEYVDRPETLKRLDQVTRLLCSVMKTIRPEEASKTEYSDELLEWWISHKKADEKRERAEQIEREREQIKKDALDKLSKLEKKILGLE